MLSFSAHEITHAFDDEGILYNELGQLESLYDNETTQAFHEASECIREQYSQYEILAGINVNGTATLGENIADQGGLKVAEVSIYKR